QGSITRTKRTTTIMRKSTARSSSSAKTIRLFCETFAEFERGIRSLNVLGIVSKSADGMGEIQISRDLISFLSLLRSALSFLRTESICSGSVSIQLRRYTDSRLKD